MASSPITSWQRDGRGEGGGAVETVTDWASKSLWMVIPARKLNDTCSLEEKL